MRLEIYLGDLKEEAQKKVIDFYSLDGGTGENLDVFPIFILENDVVQEPENGG